jgi:ectoine hydroxylase-related dioxygenase (phytanoyl-CoA dioxygenase family)
MRVVMTLPQALTMMGGMSTAAKTPATPVITEAQVQHYREHGHVLLPGVMAPAQLELLRAHCQAAMDRTDAEMDRQGTDVLGINHRNSRYFSTHPSHTDPELYDFIYSPLMEAVVRGILGETAHIFWEQYVVKGKEQGMRFSWHQDSGYVSADTPHTPYLTCWCALDDMSVHNGTASILPTSRLGIRSRVEHLADPEINDLVGYFGDDPGDPVLCPAGSIALFSSVTFHRSGWNRSDAMRRVSLIQYSDAVIRKPGSGEPWGRTECFLRDGERIAERSARPALG